MKNPIQVGDIQIVKLIVLTNRRDDLEWLCGVDEEALDGSISIPLTGDAADDDAVQDVDDGDDAHAGQFRRQSATQRAVSIGWPSDYATAQ